MKVDIWLEVLLSCNLRCGFCYNEFQAFPRSSQRRVFLTRATAQAILDAVRRSREVHRITLAGGEFFSHPRWRDLIEVAKAACSECVIVTNGTVMPNGTASTLAALDVNLIQFSLHGSVSEVHDQIVGRRGAFEALLHAAADAANVGLPIGFTYVWQGQPADDLVGVVEWASVLGASFVVVNEVRAKSVLESPSELAMRKRNFVSHLRMVDEAASLLAIPVIASTYFPNEILKSWDLLAVRPASPTESNPRLNIDCLGNLRPCLTSTASWGNIVSGNSCEVLAAYLERQPMRNGGECNCSREVELWRDSMRSESESESESTQHYRRL